MLLLVERRWRESYVLGFAVLVRLVHEIGQRRRDSSSGYGGGGGRGRAATAIAAAAAAARNGGANFRLILLFLPAHQFLRIGQRIEVGSHLFSVGRGVTTLIRGGSIVCPFAG